MKHHLHLQLFLDVFQNQNSRYNQKELYLKALDKVWQEIPERFAPEDSNRRFNFKVAVSIRSGSLLKSSALDHGVVEEQGS